MPKYQTFSTQVRFVASWLAVFLVIEIVNLLLNRSLTVFGIYPRDIVGLRGIAFSPFLHGSLSHFASNFLTLGLFSFLLLQFSKQTFFKVTFFVIVITGILVWCFARSAMHIGASGLVYGYLGFLLLGGILSKRFHLILLSILVGFFYGGLLYGVLPRSGFVSWESHLFGFLSGLMAAKLWASRRN